LPYHPPTRMDRDEPSQKAQDDGAPRKAPFETLTGTHAGRPPSPPESEASAPLPRGATLGRYVVLERLGEGGMGVVYAAYDFGLDRKVSLKLVRGQKHSPERQERLLREAQAMARLSHPNALAVHDVGSHEQQVFIAMEYVSGDTLAQWLRARPRRPHEVMEAFVQAGRGLAAAHEVGLVHRDFKPSNVLRDETGRVRVIDFGLALLVAEAQAAHEEGGRTSAFSGTTAYMAPEQRRGLPADPRSDQYAFCVSLHEGLCGIRPVAAGDVSALALARVPKRVAEVLARGLSEDPSARYPTLNALLDQLEKHRRPAYRGVALGGGLALAGGLLGLFAASVRGEPASVPAPRACEAPAPSKAPTPFGESLAHFPACMLPTHLQALPWGAALPERLTSQQATSPWMIASPGSPSAALETGLHSVETAAPRRHRPPSSPRSLPAGESDSLQGLQTEDPDVTSRSFSRFLTLVLERLTHLLEGPASSPESSTASFAEGNAAFVSPPWSLALGARSSNEGLLTGQGFNLTPTSGAGGSAHAHLADRGLPSEGHTSDEGKAKLEALEQALARDLAANSSPARIAADRFALAQMLWDTRKDQTRAITLAQQALSDLSAPQSPLLNDIDFRRAEYFFKAGARWEIESWIEERTPKQPPGYKGSDLTVSQDHSPLIINE